MADDLREFYESLNREELALASDIATDRLGLLMRVAINELDLDFEGGWAWTGTDGRGRTGLLSVGNQEEKVHPSSLLRTLVEWSVAVLSV